MTSGNADEKVLASFAAVGGFKVRAEEAALLHGALKSGFLLQFREPVGIAELSAATGMRDDVLHAACAALKAIGVLTDNGDGRMAVSDLYAPLLMAGGMAERAVDALEATTVRGPILRQLFDGSASNYWTLGAEARIVLARNAGVDVRTPWGLAQIASTVRNVPGWEEALVRGARTLDMGCGIGSRVCGTVSIYPKVTAVGVDLADDVLAIGRERAKELGITDRATFLLADAATFLDPDGFDVVWSPQTFFAEPSRRNAAASAYANLRPGGLMVTVDPPAPDADGNRPLTSGPVIENLLRAVWDIPSVSGDALRAELEQVGFVDIAGPWPSPPVQPYLTARRPIS